MKKTRLLLNIILCVLLTASAFALPIFSQVCCNTQAVAAEVDDFRNPQDVIGIDLPESYSHAPAPFNSYIGEYMDGEAFYPNSTAQGQVLPQSFTLGETFKISTQRSLYLWVFIPNEAVVVQDDLKSCSFSIRFALLKSGTEQIAWEYSSAELENMFKKYSGGSVSFGWKLFELNFAGANGNAEQLDDLEFNQFSISYSLDSVSLSGLQLNSQKLAIYHVLLADKKSGSSGIIDSFDYCNYALTNEYKQRLLNLYLGDTFKFGSVSGIFEFINVGLLDLREVTPSDFKWYMRINRGNTVVSDSANLEFLFDVPGWHSITIELKQKLYGREINILNYSRGVDIMEFTLGKFLNSSLNLRVGERQDVIFSPNSDFNKLGDYQVKVSDNSVLEATYYEQDGQLHLVLLAKKKGKVTVSVTAKGSRALGGEQKNYSQLCSVRVDNANQSSWQLTVVWITFACLSAILVVFVLISVVKARKNDVK